MVMFVPCVFYAEYHIFEPYQKIVVQLDSYGLQFGHCKAPVIKKNLKIQRQSCGCYSRIDSIHRLWASFHRAAFVFLLELKTNWVFTVYPLQPYEFKLYRLNFWYVHKDMIFCSEKYTGTNTNIKNYHWVWPQNQE